MKSTPVPVFLGWYSERIVCRNRRKTRIQVTMHTIYVVLCFYYEELTFPSTSISCIVMNSVFEFSVNQGRENMFLIHYTRITHCSLSYKAGSAIDYISSIFHQKVWNSLTILLSFCTYWKSIVDQSTVNLQMKNFSFCFWRGKNTFYLTNKVLF